MAIQVVNVIEQNTNVTITEDTNNVTVSPGAVVNIGSVSGGDGVQQGDVIALHLALG